jgi:L-lactate dehydrogenase complex protein LldF
VLVDNGRSRLLANEEFRRSLHCIRCGACMNTCPVYRRSGGYSYSTSVPGPIGSILAPARDPHDYHSLPFACSLCGSCTDVCPVKIDLHHQLLTMRRELARQRALPFTKRWSMKVLGLVLRKPWLYHRAGGLARWLLRKLPRWLIYNRLNGWGRQRELPPSPSKTFRQMFRERHERQPPSDS